MNERIYEILSSQFDPFILFSLHPNWHIPEANAEDKNSKSFDEAKSWNIDCDRENVDGCADDDGQ